MTFINDLFCTKQAVVVVAQEGFRDEEYTQPCQVLEAQGFDVVTASSRVGTCTGRFGTKAEATLTVEDALDTPWNIVVFVGGGGATEFFDDESAHALARSAVARGAVLGAICIAPTILSRAELLGGYVATSFPSEQMELVSNGAKWTGRPVESASVIGTGATIVTANGPQAAQEFGETLVASCSQYGAEFVAIDLLL